MHTIEEVRKYFPENMLNLKVIHHRSPVGFLCDSEFYKNKKIKLSPDMVVLQVNDDQCHFIGSINKITFDNPEQSIEIIVPVYKRWFTKVEYLMEYIHINYDALPEYLLYLDGADTAILNDILEPKAMLDFYKCDILFNVEPNYCHSGLDVPSLRYYDSLCREHKDTYIQLNEKKYGIAHDRSLNAGIFLGKKDAILDVLKEAYLLMIDDPSKGLPYGAQCDQAVLKILQNKYFDIMACDIYNLYFLFAYPKSLEVSEDNWEHFEYFKKHYFELYK